MFLDNAEVSELIAEVLVDLLTDLVLPHLLFAVSQVPKTVGAFKGIVLGEEDSLRDRHLLVGQPALLLLEHSYRDLFLLLIVAHCLDLV